MDFDADWAGGRLDCKPTSGYDIIAAAAVSWKSKKQPFVITLSAEARHIAFGAAAQKCTYSGQKV